MSSAERWRASRSTDQHQTFNICQNPSSQAKFITFTKAPCHNAEQKPVWMSEGETISQVAKMWASGLDLTVVDTLCEISDPTQIKETKKKSI